MKNQELYSGHLDLSPFRSSALRQQNLRFLRLKLLYVGIVLAILLQHVNPESKKDSGLLLPLSNKLATTVADTNIEHVKIYQKKE